MRIDIPRLEAIFGCERVDTWAPPRPALEGFVPTGIPLIAPGSLSEAREAMRFAAQEKLRVIPVGAGEHIHLGAPALDADLLLTTRNLNRVLEYDPEDLTLVAQAGLTLHSLQAATSESGQRLAPEIAPGVAATVGGAVAADRMGFNGLRAGRLRDAVLGARVIHADGTLTKAGGKVVKNVTGYDLVKLYVGSRGSLVLLAEVNLRLVACPQQSLAVVCRVDPSEGRETFLDLQNSGLQPVASLAVSGQVTRTLQTSFPEMLMVARFEGREAVVRDQAQRLLERRSGRLLEGESLAEAVRELVEFLEPQQDSILVRISSLPADILEFLQLIPVSKQGAQAAVAQFGIGTTHVRLARESLPDLGAWFKRLEERGARVQVEYAPMDLGISQPASADSPAPELQQSMKAVFDPEGRLRGLPAQRAV